MIISPLTSTADEVAVGSSSATFSTLLMNATEALGVFLYQYCANVASWIAQGGKSTSPTFTANDQNAANYAALSFAAITFTADHTTNHLSATAHGLITGDGPIQLTESGGGLPTGLAAVTNYWVVKVDANTFELAASLANAFAATVVTFSTNGTGTLKANSVTGTLSPVGTFTCAGHGFATGAQVQVSNTGGGLPTGLSTATNYYVIAIDANTFLLATSNALALAGTALAISTNGTGTQSVVVSAAASAGSMYVPANTPVILDGAHGVSLAVIEDSTGGKASLVQVVGERP